MTLKKTVTVNDLLNQLSLKSETDLNNYLHSLLDSDKLVDWAKKTIPGQTRVLRQFKDLTDKLAHRLNIPTRDDLANIAQLSIQVEEKLDTLEEKFSGLIDQLQNNGVNTLGSNENDLENTRVETTEESVPSAGLDSLLQEIVTPHSQRVTIKQLQRELLFNLASIKNENNISEEILTSLKDRLSERV